MDQDRVFVEAYTAALKGAVNHYGVIEKEDDYQRLRQFCERAAKDAVVSFQNFVANGSQG
jgi:endonuclease III-like uncharacterized protein